MADKPQGITAIKVEGFKSLYEMKEPISIRPLTLLAGANSSGKSSLMQPLLLMKQTLEAKYEPIVFKIDGPNVNFTDDRQFLSGPYDINVQGDKAYFLTITIEINSIGQFKTFYTKPKEYQFIPLEIWEMSFRNDETTIGIGRNLTNEQIIQIIGEDADKLREATEPLAHGNLRWRVVPDRSFLSLAIYSENDVSVIDLSQMSLKIFPLGILKQEILNIIHVPGLRGNPQRSYPVTRIDTHFEGTFEPYTASIIYDWTNVSDERLERLIEQIRLLNLASLIRAEPINDAQLQIMVARTIDAANINDMVSIADVGFGVSQVLPVLVALLVAKPGQLVYLEQPELHLHPRAQVKLAEIIADAAKRGVRVVVETHSSLLLLGIQTLIAENKLHHKDVILHWFTRGEDGKTTVNSVEPDENGAYGDWPEDFADVELKAQSDFMEAVEKRELEQQRGS